MRRALALCAALGPMSAGAAPGVHLCSAPPPVSALADEAADHAALAVSVSDVDGRPVADAFVELSGPGGFSRSRATGADGGAWFPGLDAGSYLGVVRRQGYRAVAVPPTVVSEGRLATRSETLLPDPQGFLVLVGAAGDDVAPLGQAYVHITSVTEPVVESSVPLPDAPKWRWLAVRCKDVRFRVVLPWDGEALLPDVPLGQACTARLSGGVPALEIPFTGGDARLGP